MFRGIASLTRKERVDLNDLKSHMRHVDTLKNQKLEAAMKDRQDAQ